MTDPSQAQQIPADKPIMITMELQHWNMIIGLLGKAPYEVVQPYIDAIRMQATQQLTPPPMQVGNGVDHGERSDYSQGTASAAGERLRPAGEGEREGGEGTGKLSD